VFGRALSLWERVADGRVRAAFQVRSYTPRFMRPLLRYWLPPFALAVIIVVASGAELSAGHTREWLLAIVHAFLGHPLEGRRFELLHFAVRKLGHLTEYGLLGLLNFRALRGERRGIRGAWLIGAVALATGVACIDEIRQSFVPSRTGSPVDVLWDTAGAAIAQAAIAIRLRRR
jgi:VanZ family protein